METNRVRTWKRKISSRRMGLHSYVHCTMLHALISIQLFVVISTYYLDIRTRAGIYVCHLLLRQYKPGDFNECFQRLPERKVVFSKFKVELPVQFSLFTKQIYQLRGDHAVRYMQQHLPWLSFVLSCSCWAHACMTHLKHLSSEVITEHNRALNSPSRISDAFRFPGTCSLVRSLRKRSARNPFV